MTEEQVPDDGFARLGEGDFSHWLQIPRAPQPAEISGINMKIQKQKRGKINSQASGKFGFEKFQDIKVKRVSDRLKFESNVF